MLILATNMLLMVSGFAMKMTQKTMIFTEILIIIWFYKIKEKNKRKIKMKN